MRKSYINFNAGATTKGGPAAPKKTTTAAEAPAATAPEDGLGDVTGEDPDSTEQQDDLDADLTEGAEDTDIESPEDAAIRIEAEAMAKEAKKAQQQERTQDYADSLDIIMAPGLRNTHIVRVTDIVVDDVNSPFHGKKRRIVNFGLRTFADAEAGRVNASMAYPLESNTDVTTPSGKTGTVTQAMVDLFQSKYGNYKSGDSVCVEIEPSGYINRFQPIAMVSDSHVIKGTKSAGTGAAAKPQRYIVQGGNIVDSTTSEVMGAAAPGVKDGTTYNTLPRVMPRKLAVITTASAFDNDLPF